MRKKSNRGGGSWSKKRKKKRTKVEIKTEKEFVVGGGWDGRRRETGFGPDLAILQILCRQTLVGQRGTVRGVCGWLRRKGKGITV
jgi:hypothetical protein